MISEFVTDLRSLTSKYYCYLALNLINSNTVQATLAKSDLKQKYEISGDWMQTLAYLTDNGWELLESSFESMGQNVALLRKSYYEVLPKEWLKTFGDLAGWIHKNFKRRKAVSGVLEADQTNTDKEVGRSKHPAS